MKTRILVALTIASPLMMISQAVFAADPTATPGIDRREAKQERRIEQGINSGALNQREAARLEKGEQRIERMEARAKADGKVTAQERKHLQHAENVQSRKIYREKHDAQRRK